jgi:hypothetical protein
LDLNLTIIVPTFSYTTKGVFDVSKIKGYTEELKEESDS